MTQQTKASYRIRNWSDYNKALIQRGSVNIWFSEEALNNWFAMNEDFERGRPKLYSNEAILCALIIKGVFHLPFRALQGFLLSLVQILGIALPIPCYTQICRRAKELGQQIQKLSHKRPTDIVFDSTGAKVYGEGEWKVKQHGKSKRRTWRKIHLAVCPDSHDIILECVTENNIADCEVLPKMQKHLPKSIKRCYADGAYDKEGCYNALKKANIDPIIPPQRNAVIQNEKERPWMMSRNNAIQIIEGFGGSDEARKIWKKLKGYHRRSLAETAMYRFKRIFGESLSSKKMPYQKAEVFAKCLALNKMNALGMPKGDWIPI